MDRQATTHSVEGLQKAGEQAVSSNIANQINYQSNSPLPRCEARNLVDASLFRTSSRETIKGVEVKITYCTVIQDSRYQSLRSVRVCRLNTEFGELAHVGRQLRSLTENFNHDDD